MPKIIKLLLLLKKCKFDIAHIKGLLPVHYTK